MDLKKDFDINNSVQRKEELTDDQIQALLQRGFEEMRVKTLMGESDIFILRNETEETDEHFVLQHLILADIKRYTDKGLIHHTRLPDVTFETKSGKIIAIEVEADVGIKRSLDNMSEKLQIMKKYDDYFYVVGNPAIKREYESKFGNVILREEVHDRIASYFT